MGEANTRNSPNRVLVDRRPEAEGNVRATNVAVVGVEEPDDHDESDCVGESGVGSAERRL